MIYFWIRLYLKEEDPNLTIGDNSVSSGKNNENNTQLGINMTKMGLIMPDWVQIQEI